MSHQIDKKTLTYVHKATPSTAKISVVSVVQFRGLMENGIHTHTYVCIYSLICIYARIPKGTRKTKTY